MFAAPVLALRCCFHSKLETRSVQCELATSNLLWVSFILNAVFVRLFGRHI